MRGAGVSVDRVRKAQQAGLALVANAVLQSQAISMRQWLGHDEGVDSDVRGFVAMWDEASQRARALLRGTHASRAQCIVEVFVMLSAVHLASPQVENERWAWQPWLATPMLLRSTQHRAVLDALDSCMPFAFKDRDSVCRFGHGVKAAVLSFCFDYASSNISAYRHMVHVVSNLP